MSQIEYRTLLPADRTSFLDLMQIAFAERELFERYLDHDPQLRDRDTLIACDDGRLVASVQVFTRTIRLKGEAVPLGRYAREWLQMHGNDADLAERVVITEHARATLSAVELGHVDLAIVYASDARLARHARVIYEIPPGEQPRIRYVAGRVMRGPKQASEAFLRYLGQAGPRAILARQGFTTAEDPRP